MIFALGAGDRVAGVSDYDTYPPEVLDIPRVGALLDPNLERIFELRPDLVVTYGTQSTLRTRLGSAGIRTFPFVTGSIDDMLRSIGQLAEVLGDPEAGRDLAGRIRGSLDDTAGRATGPRPSVLLAHSRDVGTLGGFYTEGGTSYLSELVEVAGGHNLFGDVPATSFQPSLETVLERAPEVVIELLPSSAGTPAEIRRRLEDWSRLDTLPAVRNRRVYVLADDSLLLIGPRLHLAAADLAEVIHPLPGPPRE
jgi:iron complex transport system substrate-binding protein